MMHGLCGRHHVLLIISTWMEMQISNICLHAKPITRHPYTYLQTLHNLAARRKSMCTVYVAGYLVPPMWDVLCTTLLTSIYLRYSPWIRWMVGYYCIFVYARLPPDCASMWTGRPRQCGTDVAGESTRWSNPCDL